MVLHLMRLFFLFFLISANGKNCFSADDREDFLEESTKRRSQAEIQEDISRELKITKQFFEEQKGLFDEIKKEKNDHIQTKNQLIESMKDQERSSVARITSIIRLVDRNVKIPSQQLSLTDAITVLESLIRERTVGW